METDIASNDVLFFTGAKERTGQGTIVVVSREKYVRISKFASLNLKQN